MYFIVFRHCNVAQIICLSFPSLLGSKDKFISVFLYQLSQPEVIGKLTFLKIFSSNFLATHEESISKYSNQAISTRY